MILEGEQCPTGDCAGVTNPRKHSANVVRCFTAFWCTADSAERGFEWNEAPVYPWLQPVGGIGFGVVGGRRRSRRSGAGAANCKAQARAALGIDHAAAPARGHRRHARHRGR